MAVRAKFYVQEVTPYGQSVAVKLHAVYDDGIPENQRFARASPFGELKLTIDNPGASDQFKQGRICYLDLNWLDEQ